MRILITGGAGFIGSNLARLCVERGHEVVVLDDLSTGHVDNLSGVETQFIHGSILDDDALHVALNGAESVVHLAALGSVPRSIADPVSTHQVNATGTLQVLEAARRSDVRHVVCASSSSVYGLNPALPKHEREWVRPVSPYAVSKLATEQYTLAYQQSFDLKTLAFRFFNVYGPYQRPGHAYAAVVPIFLDAALRGAPLPVNGEGTQSRDFTYVDTVCSVLMDAAERQVSHPEPVNLAFGTNTTINSLVGVVREVTGIECAVTHREPRKGDVPHSQAANQSLRHLFPDAHPVDLSSGVERTSRWMSSFLKA